MSDKRKKDRGETLKSRLSGPSESAEASETADDSETEEMSETSGTAETPGASDGSDTSETSEMSEMSGTEEGEDESETSETSETVKSRKNVNMYLPESLVNEMSIRYSELDARHQRVHGRSMEKNRDYYPAIIEAGITGEDIESILDLE